MASKVPFLLDEAAQRPVHVRIDEIGACGLEAVERDVRAGRSSAGADESMDVTWPAPPASAATVKPPV
jgi:hypothetical protein